MHGLTTASPAPRCPASGSCPLSIGFPVESAEARHRFYTYSNWMYQAGVFVSRSSGMLYQARLRTRAQVACASSMHSMHNPAAPPSVAAFEPPWVCMTCPQLTQGRRTAWPSACLALVVRECPMLPPSAAPLHL